MFKKMKNNKGSVLVIGFLLAIAGITTSALVKGYGREPVRKCAGTHTNGNCYNLPLTDHEKNTFNWIE